MKKNNKKHVKETVENNLFRVSSLNYIKETCKYKKMVHLFATLYVLARYLRIFPDRTYLLLGFADSATN